MKLLAQAEEWQGWLDAGRVRTRAEIAATVGLSAPRVSNILALAELPDARKDAIRRLPPGTPERLVTERALRRERHDALRGQRVAPGARLAQGFDGARLCIAAPER